MPTGPRSGQPRQHPPHVVGEGGRLDGNDVRRAGRLAEVGVTGMTSDDPRVHAYAAGC
ncbi:MAG TPA: hypothetical protein VE547_05875 [Mycobacteriales bacterium]|nr:hypothetical protein [Mycobacteriales bacterium]